MYVFDLFWRQMPLCKISKLAHLSTGPHPQNKDNVPTQRAEICDQPFRNSGFLTPNTFVETHRLEYSTYLTTEQK